ncbi:hypothetical protein P691DRAFT_244057 [Macrolepiota fuliginosa MF-IS2]|uniref:PH domain-containing protein n=1 Tax=Macrolepiota fuliginosa MF-IS2 TaxID=1400762 RepID=A0A9P5X842_9AGAR|nr:hypothetical protein P691DRAFT_244057 [Macrolepiota fuliginosa MF-IS2]
MKATLTDVQKAIEQLGRDHGDNDGGRSFSFASTRDDRDTDTDFDLSDLDGADDAEDVEGWHKGARMKLAEKARRAVEEAEKLEAMMGGLGANAERRSAPPIEVELSDESDDEVEREGFTTRSTAIQGIPEEDEDVETDGEPHLSRGKDTVTGTPAASITPPANEDNAAVSLTLSEKDETELGTATATRSSFRLSPSPQANPNVDSSPPTQSPEPNSSAANPSSTLLPAGVGVKAESPVPFPAPAAESTRSSTPLRGSTPLSRSLSPPVAATSPKSLPRAMSPPIVASNTNSKHTSVASVGSFRGLAQSTAIPAPAPEPMVPLPPVPVPAAIAPPVAVFAIQPVNSTSTMMAVASSPPAVSPPVLVVEEKKEKPHPSEWTLEDVVDWLKSKGFDQDVCDKFTEQEITGDVLLELDVNLLKTEIGIMAFGKRVRISNAITELRRPPSITYSDHHTGSGSMVMVEQTMHTPLSPQSQTHSRTQSQSQSHHSFPGSGAVLGHTYSQSISSSLGSPLAGINGFGHANGASGVGAGANGGAQVVNYGGVQSGVGGGVGQLVESPSSQGYVNVGKADMEGGAVGLGISESNGFLKPRPAQLSLSPSDGALNTSAAIAIQPQSIQEEAEERGHMSDGEIPPTSRMRRRLFGRSHDSASSSLRHSKDMSPMGSPIPEREKEKDKEREGSVSSKHGKSKRSVDGGKGSERLSIFGGTFGGSLKGRKPPPSANIEETHSEKTSTLFGLPRLHSSSVRKSSSGNRSATPTGSPGKATQEFMDLTSPKQERTKSVREGIRDSGVLRKRTVSSPSTNGTSPTAATGVSAASPAGLVKPGQSILEQIGDPDHVGWMRKRSDRYNSWKNRYFVLKGPHMYCLRSDSKSTKIKGYIHIVGYKVSVDENLDPGRYGFRIDHDNDRTHFFSSDEKAAVRDWMKAIMKATIDRDYTKPVVSSCNIPTIPLTVAQAMNPAPRPPSPTARAATQKALRRENPNQLSTRDAQILMGLSSNSNDAPLSATTDEYGQIEPVSPTSTVAAKLNALGPGSAGPAPPRPSREMRRTASMRSSAAYGNGEDALVEWANSHLPHHLRIQDPAGPLCSGLGLLRLAESIKGKPSSPPVLDSAFPLDPNDDKLDGLFRLFDFLLDNDVKMGSVSINDVRQAKRDKVLQLLKALKAWEDKRRAIAQSIGKGAVQAGGFVAF